MFLFMIIINSIYYWGDNTFTYLLIDMFAINKMTVQQYADRVHVCLSDKLLILQFERK